MSPPDEADARRLVERLLAGVPLARTAGPTAYLQALTDAALFFPVFRDSPSPVLGWLDELTAVLKQYPGHELAATVQIRRATVLMRLNQLTEAYEVLQAVREANPRDQAWAAATRSRIATRRHDFASARAALERAESTPLDRADWVAQLAPIARGELAVEEDERGVAEQTLRQLAVQLPPDWLEEQVQVLQLLGFLRIAAADARGAVRYLDSARQVVRGAGAWPEVLQMDLVLGSLYQPLGDATRSADLLDEAQQLSAHADPSGLAPLIELAQARPLLDAGKAEEAAARCLSAARLLAERGDAPGFVTAVAVLSGIHVRRKMYPEAYRVLATGLGIARHLDLPIAQQVLSGEIARLRDTVVGPERFATMVELMLQQARRGKSDANSEPYERPDA